MALSVFSMNAYAIAWPTVAEVKAFRNGWGAPAKIPALQQGLVRSSSHGSVKTPLLGQVVKSDSPEFLPHLKPNPTPSQSLVKQQKAASAPVVARRPRSESLSIPQQRASSALDQFKAAIRKTQAAQVAGTLTQEHVSELKYAEQRAEQAIIASRTPVAPTPARSHVVAPALPHADDDLIRDVVANLSAKHGQSSVQSEQVLGKLSGMGFASDGVTVTRVNSNLSKGSIIPSAREAAWFK